MKKYIIIGLIICSNFIMAQKPLDTIYANKNKSVALFFPEAIRQGITGSSNFVFTYNREKEHYFGLLRAELGAESNLLTITKNGDVYSYILKYKDQLSKLNYFITENESIGSERPKRKEKKIILKPQNKEANRIAYFEKFSDYLLKSKYETISIKRDKGIKLQLQKMTYNASEVYLVFEIKNNSGVDFEIDYFKVFMTTGNKKKKASYQSLEQDIIYKHKIPSIIMDKQSKRFVCVLPKFVLGDNEKLMLELKELNGNRDVSLESRSN